MRTFEAPLETLVSVAAPHTKTFRCPGFPKSEKTKLTLSECNFFIALLASARFVTFGFFHSC